MLQVDKGSRRTDVVTDVAEGGKWLSIQDVLKDHTTLPGPVRSFMELANPDKYACDCKLLETEGDNITSWGGELGSDEYHFCEQAAKQANSAWSFGIRHLDSWSEMVNTHLSLVPNTFDCFDTKKPEGFANNFKSVCLGAEAGDVEGRAYDTLPRLLEGAEEGKALVKMDIEGSEYEALDNISLEVLKSIGSLHVEFHLTGISPNFASDHLKPLAVIMEKLSKTHAVVFAKANYYGNIVLDDAGVPIPAFLQVDYTSHSTCK